MEVFPNMIQGGSHNDERGTLNFFNDFDMEQVKRFYTIHHPNVDTIRGWRGHQIEQRWFSVTQGAFKINLVKIDNWKNPNSMASVQHYELSALTNTVFHVPAGYASSLQALEPNSTILVFGDYNILNAKNDDFLYANDYF